MIYNFEHNTEKNNPRPKVLEYLKSKQFSRVIDVGASVLSWARDSHTHYVDIQKCTSDCGNAIGFYGDISLLSTWKPILEDVEKNGKFDFAICSHTLEDISSPKFVCEMLCEIAKEGFVAVPSKCKELTRGISPGYYYGYTHHKWIYNKEDNKFVGYPKLNFIEYVDWSPITNNCNYKEISFFWKDSFTLEIVNNDYMGPSCAAIKSYYKNLENN